MTKGIIVSPANRGVQVVVTDENNVQLLVDSNRGVNLEIVPQPRIEVLVDKGVEGAQGPQGPQGTAATVTAGTTTTGVAGTNANVTNSGTSSAAVFDFTIPRGDTGATGAGVATGGTTGQFLQKASNANYDTTWATITGTLVYQGSWNASTNTPTLTSSVGTNGYYYVVGTSGSTNLNGITDWVVGDWAIFNGSVWQKIDNTDLVSSVNGQTGVVVLDAADVGALAITNNLSDLANAPTARTNLGLGSIATQDANNVAITGGTINNTTIGATTPSTGVFTTLTATGQTSLGGAAGSESLRVSSVSSAVNYIQINGAATGTSPSIQTLGSSNTQFLNLYGRGTAGGTNIGSGTTTQFAVRGVSGSATVNYLQANGSTTSTAPILSAQGSDTNISQVFQSKGTGAIDLAAGSSGVNISNGGTVTALTRTAGGSAYTSFPSVAITAPTTAGGVQATATVTRMFNSTPTIQSGGTGYTVGDVLTIVGGTPVTVAGTYTVATVSAGVITSVTNTLLQAYTALPTNPVSVTGGTGSGATLNLTYQVDPGGLTIGTAGSGYVEQPTVTFSGGGGSGAAAYATVGANTVVRSLNDLSIFTPGGEQVRVADRNLSVVNYVQLSGASTTNAPRVSGQGSDTNVVLFLSSKGNAQVSTYTNNFTVEQFRVAHTASAVNYVQVTGNVTGSGPIISSQGSDTNIDLLFSTKGTAGSHVFRTNTTVRQFQVNHVTSAVNYGVVTGSITGNAVPFTVAGTDTNISQVFQTKGTGAIDLAAGSSGVNISNGGTVTAITGTAFGSNYTSAPSVVISAPTTAGGVQATATIPIQVGTVTISSGGTGYTVNDVLTVVGGTFTTVCQLTVSAVSGGVITAVTTGGTARGNYTVAPSNPASVTGGTGSGATFTLNFAVANNTTFTITNAGSGYVEQPTVTFSGGGGSGAAAYATVGTNAFITGLGSSLRFANAGGLGFQVGNSGTSTVNYLSAQGSSTGNAVLLSAAGADSNIAVRFSSLGTSSVSLFTNNSGQEQLRVAHTASAVNYVQVTGAATGSPPAITVQGSDSNIRMNISSKGTESFDILTNNTGTRAGRFTHTASAVNWVQMTGAAAGVAPSYAVAGNDTNIDLALTTKGTGLVRFGTYSSLASTTFSIDGYIEIKDSAGNIRKLAVIV